MATPNRTCVICSKKYRYCPTCSEDIKKPTWMGVFCGDNCHDIYTAIVEYRDKKITKNEAFVKLQKLDTSCYDALSEGTKKLYDEICYVEPVVEEVKEEISVEEVFEEIKEVETEKESIKKSRNKKRSYE